MELSMFIAKLFGVVYVGLGLGILFYTDYYKKLFVDITKNNTFIFMWSIMALVIGLVVILNHNIWEASWVVIITLVGWIGFVKGAVMLVFPKVAGYFGSWFKSKAFLIVTGVGSVIFGGILCYFGFFL